MNADPLRPGPITFQRKNEDGSWEETPGWLSWQEMNNYIHIRLDERAILAANSNWEFALMVYPL